MECPKCGTQNAATSRFCMNCGYEFPNRPPQGIPGPRPRRDPVSQIALVFGISGTVGGGLTVLGWLLPWLGFGGLAGALNRLGLGSKFGIGIGSGPKVSGALLLGSLAAFSFEDTGALIGLLGLLILGVFVSLPILGVQNVRAGFWAIQLGMASNTSSRDRSVLVSHMGRMRNRSKYIFVILLIIFLGMTMIPFVGTSVLGSGFYLTVIGAVCSYLGPFFYQSRLSSLPKQSG
jgi:hypothetical protein